MINKIKIATNRIPRSSYEMMNPQLTNEGLETGYSKNNVYPERDFVSKLCHYLLISEDFNDLGLDVNTDIYKNIQHRPFSEPLFDKTKNKFFPDSKGIVPDLIIHGGQNNTDPNFQKLALECKLNPRLSYDEFCIDLFKLMIYKKIFNFQFLCFLIIHKNPATISSFYTSYINEYYIDKESLHILVKENYESELECIIHNEEPCEG